MLCLQGNKLNKRQIWYFVCCYSGGIDLQDINNYQLGKGIRKVIPSCSLWSICEKYPSADGSYIPFKESQDNEARQLYGDN